MNLKTWNSLPKDIQRILLKLREDYAAHYAKLLMAFEKDILKRWSAKHGVRVRKISAADDKLARAAGKKAQEYFLKKQESAGHPARESVHVRGVSAVQALERLRIAFRRGTHVPRVRGALVGVSVRLGQPFRLFHVRDLRRRQDAKGWSATFRLVAAS